MRALVLPTVALALAGAVVLVGGRMVESPAGMDSMLMEEPDAERGAAAEGPVASTTAAPAAASPFAEEPAQQAEKPSTPAEPTTSDAATMPSSGAEQLLSAAPMAVQVPAQPASRLTEIQPELHTPSRMVAPIVVAPPGLDGEELQREAPREPLSQLSLALPLPEHKNAWAGKPLFRPVALESAVFESGGHRIAIDGVKSISPDESCAYEGTSWPCGVRARAAFRLWLRGRALVCQIPEEAQDGQITRARCRLAKQDVGAWLVANGWARAAPGGPYVQAEEKARAQGIGIFGAPPDTSSVPDVPELPVSRSAESQPIMTEEGVDPQPSLEPRLQFPPAPPPQP